MPDTASLELFNYGPRNASMKKHVSREYSSGNSWLVENMGDATYMWDKEGRIIRYSEYYAGDTLPYRDVRYRFLIQQKLADMIVTQGNYVDTIGYQYNRSGLTGTWKRHTIGADSGRVINGTNMYDSRGRVIVATNTSYGPLEGSFTYEYDNQGRLVRRCFLAGGTGVVLCTDTIEYQASANQLVTIETHRLKIAAAEKWTTLESRSIYPASGVVISYTDYNPADTNYFYRNYDEYTVRYEYDDKGRVSGEFFGTTVEPDIIQAKFYYGKYNQPDSIVYSERVTEKKASITRVYSRDVRSYDNLGRIETRTVTTYFFEEKKKKDKVVPMEVVTITYKWQ